MAHGFLGYGSALLATIIWSGNFVVSRAVAHLIPPWQCNFWRWLVALLVILPFAWKGLHADWPAIRKEWRYLTLMAILGVTLMNTLIYKAGQTTTSLNMALLVPTAPVVILIFSRLIYGEPLTARRLAGVGLVLCGVVLLVSRGDLARLTGLHFTSGDAWALAGAFCFGLYSLFMRRRPRDLSALGFNVATFAIGLVLSLPFTVAEACLLPLPEASAPVIISVLYTGVGCSFLSFWLWTLAVDRIGPVRAGMVYYSLPIFAAAGSFLVLGERVTGAQLVGGALIIGGILAATWPHKNAHAAAQQGENRDGHENRN
ncbi:MAG: DMT family transporter [Desulfovibrio sp.]|nr:DMT family transporter [Desulfovibrio sp.]